MPQANEAHREPICRVRNSAALGQTQPQPRCRAMDGPVKPGQDVTKGMCRDLWPPPSLPYDSSSMIARFARRSRVVNSRHMYFISLSPKAGSSALRRSSCAALMR